MYRTKIIAVSIVLFMTFAKGCVFKESAIETTLEWARLATLPVSKFLPYLKICALILSSAI
jgi:hypothetical protein